MPDISVLNYQQKFTIPKAQITRAVAICAKALRLKHEAISIVFVGATRMRSMNKKFLNHDYATDVITFDSGDIVICPTIAKSFAKAYGQSVNQEIILYVVHGLLHLAGYNDKSPSDVVRMRAMEKKMLALL